MNRVSIVHGLKVFSLYHYTTEFEAFIYQFKESFDIALAPIFIYPFRRQLNHQYLHHLGMYAPSSLEKTKQRGFLPLEYLYQDLKIDKHIYFSKENVNQKDQDIHQRLLIHQSIRYCGPKLSHPSRIVLLDDVITTGATLHAMYDQLKHQNTQISACVLAIHPNLLNKPIK
jgi:predicted amidophosphoribosyltransferase